MHRKLKNQFRSAKGIPSCNSNNPIKGNTYILQKNHYFFSSRNPVKNKIFQENTLPLF